MKNIKRLETLIAKFLEIISSLSPRNHIIYLLKMGRFSYYMICFDNDYHSLLCFAIASNIPFQFNANLSFTLYFEILI